MSTLGGIYNFDSRPVDERLLIAIGDSLVDRGPDGGSHFSIGPLGMVYRAFHTNKQSRSERQPFVSTKGCLLCWDGRLDNRRELMSLLGDDLSEDHTDVAIVAACFHKWKEDFLPRLIGDYALSLWDHKTQTLLLARDQAGPRPLFYHWIAERIVWSSELTPLIDLPGLDLQVDDEFVAGFLANSLGPHLTPYKSVHAVPPGHVVKAQNGSLRVQRFWRLNPNHEIRYKTDAEYEEHFRHLFREAVRCRLRVDGSIWSTLSGGLDSSAIVCMADEILESGQAEAAKLETVSYVYDESTSCDELNFIECVEKSRGRAGTHLREGDYPLLTSFPPRSDLTYPDFVDCFFARHRGLCQAMQQDGARVLLTGHGGDEVLCSGATPSFELGDLLLQGKLLDLHRCALIWSKTLRKSYISMLWRELVMPLLPRRAQIAFGVVPKNFKLPAWFDEKFVARMKLRERNLHFGNVFGFRLPSERGQASGFLSAVGFVSRASFRTRGSIEVSHPYLDRSLVEFLQAIPHEQRIRRGETRSLMRRALRNLLPEKVLHRKTKRGPEEAVLRATQRQWPFLQSMFADSHVQAHGYMNSGLILAALDRARHGCKTNSFTSTICLELWLQAFEDRCLKARNTAVSAGPAAQCTVVLTDKACGTAISIPQVSP